jgi:hypothetical protein
LIGTNNVDTNSRLCMSSAVAGYKQTLGADAPPCSYEDIRQAEVIFIAGANPAVAHPIVFRMIEDARAANPDLKIIVADPRRSETAEIADLHLAIKPGTDIALFNGMLHVLISEGLVDSDYVARHTHGFAPLAEIVQRYTPEAVAEVCGIGAGDIVQAARWFGQRGAALSLYCQGLNQSAHGTHNNAGIIHLHLATGQIGKPGAGPFSLTGQPNAMGGARWAACPTCCRPIAIWPIPGIGPKSPPCGESLRSRQTWQIGHRPVPRRADRRDQGGVDRLHQPGPLAAQPAGRARGPAGGGLRRVAGNLRQHRHRRLCRPAAAGDRLG